ncbi:MAG: hypothetical protein RIR70_883, partial [Pseudomonadota bacterium]
MVFAPPKSLTRARSGCLIWVKLDGRALRESEFPGHAAYAIGIIGLHLPCLTRATCVGFGKPGEKGAAAARHVGEDTPRATEKQIFRRSRVCPNLMQANFHASSVRAKTTVHPEPAPIASGPSGSSEADLTHCSHAQSSREGSGSEMSQSAWQNSEHAARLGAALRARCPTQNTRPPSPPAPALKPWQVCPEHQTHFSKGHHVD